MKKKKILITGGAGFIGVNAARRFFAEGWDVEIWDNLSRASGKKNVEWLKQFNGIRFKKVDLRYEDEVNDHFAPGAFDMVLHCAGQVAVTTSVENPRHDFENNLWGTFNLLEAMRRFSPQAFFLFASTNKVYGGMEGTKVIERNGRHEYADLPNGVSEAQPLDFHSPYGCSKGGADQYVRDYARIYGLATVSFRQSCIYGYRQFGVEDQGWVAWFTIAHALERPVTIFGDGKQTRDVLFIDDLIEAYCLAWKHREKIAGEVFNIGGGPVNQLSLNELVLFLNQENGREMQPAFAPWRPGDQKVFVADIRKAFTRFGWRPLHIYEEGIQKLNSWVKANLELFESSQSRLQESCGVGKTSLIVSS
ncbi:MAG: NAD-dependent epimerase/dehydratase family protein [Verrucomicrobiota bacterium]